MTSVAGTGHGDRTAHRLSEGLEANHVEPDGGRGERGQQNTGYLGSHHPLTEDEEQRIRELYASGLSYRKVAAKVGRSASAAEGVCKQYPPEVVAQVHQLRAEGLSFQAIFERIGRAKSYVGWLVEAMGIDRDDDDLAPMPVGA